ncbi:alpha-aminoadipic semialdehyde dehydrogenase [Anaeramoeba flamelloides]|uniref:aldehyde dehydrogenase (NAD(+)) n=1 Tax=Anaeramoeba flamelloides TaxID=1746091 RepID=A0AAV8A236_9EUKA|nr:alpha-aminoadipic semialdehyde dehydrogenase [Anaeramoeba flamelloides]KAJ6229785.1 alpha-aminoadipic semialdehyde dehydrogenase [Anaeramoeba flamelloides]|eukprot:Anaeramoba_flamelloidesa566857_4775.p1 GENE.a566857_4775~~a566857_4775.p1  ORF type:complete len:533 (+),score=120.13 a566857_4775:75-1673(+)
MLSSITTFKSSSSILLRSLSSKFTISKYPFARELGLKETNLGCFTGKRWCGSGKKLISLNPTTDEQLAEVYTTTNEEYEETVKNMEEAFDIWADVPAPKRGDIVKQLGEAFKSKKESLGKLISLEMGKIYPEGLGEVQETIDVCDYACGLSRMLNGTVFPSERENHSMFEMWNPLGLIGVITAFNFPNAVLGWNASLALATGNVCMWKGASTVPLITIASMKIMEKVFKQNGLPGALCTMILGSGRTVGEKLIRDKRMKLISFTGSTEIGRHVAEVVHTDFRSTILECGGNNAIIVCKDANIKLALRAILFAAVGTAGQRCTTTRRLIIHESRFDEFITQMVKAYKTIPMGNPLDSTTLLGPLVEKKTLKEYSDAIEAAKQQGGKILYGGHVVTSRPGNFVEPTIIEIPHDAPIVHEETFAPILYVMKFNELEEAIKINNEVPQGLSSSMFTNDLKNLFQWMGPKGSDCGLVNCNIPTSGAEIGGAFGGNKETGGGRESGSDSWKQYCRRSTCTINHGTKLPLAQGIKFGDN